MKDTVKILERDQPRTALYRVKTPYELVYIGITDDVGRRMKQHREKHWWPNADGWVEVTWYDTRAEAAAAEKDAIQNEHPRWNRAENSRPTPTVRVARTNRGEAKFKNLISVREAAVLLGVSEKTVRRYVSNGTFVAYRLGPRTIRLDRAQIEDAFVPIPTA